MAASHSAKAPTRRLPGTAPAVDRQEPDPARDAHRAVGPLDELNERAVGTQPPPEGGVEVLVSGRQAHGHGTSLGSLAGAHRRDLMGTGTCQRGSEE